MDNVPLTGVSLAISFILFTCLGIILGYFYSIRVKNLTKSIEDITENVTNIPIQGFDTRGKIFLWNRASELTYGYLRQDALGKNISDLLLVESERADFLENVKKVCESKKALAPHHWITITRNGHKKEIYSTIFPYVRGGTCREVFCIDVDVTDLKQNEKELENSKDSYKSIFNEAEVAIVLCDPDTHKILNVNQRACDMFEYSKDAMLKLSVLDISYGDKDKLLEKMNGFTAKAFYEGQQVLEWLALTKSGRIFTAEVIIKNSRIAERECVLAIVRDISQRKRIEELLKDSQKRYCDLLANSNALIFTLDRDGMITGANQAVKNMLKFDPDEVLGKYFADFVSEEEKPRVREAFKSVIAGNAKNNIELKCRAKSGKVCVLLVNCWSEYDREGEICGVHGEAIDITEQKLVVERMREMVMQIVCMLSETVSVADRYTEQHCERLSEFALKIGLKLRLSNERMEHLKFAALLHDVGKVGIPINILVKKDKLSDEEWQKIKEHPKKGADIVRQLSGFEEVALIIEQHQEKVDGTGYPLGLTSEQIKKEATIISVVDAFDAMTSDRPYRKAMPAEEALAELKKNAGTQFDPEVVDAFVDIIRAELKQNSSPKPKS